MCLESSLKCVKLTRNSRTFPLNDAVSGYDGRQTEKFKVNSLLHIHYRNKNADIVKKWFYFLIQTQFQFLMAMEVFQLELSPRVLLRPSFLT